MLRSFKAYGTRSKRKERLLVIKIQRWKKKIERVIPRTSHLMMNPQKKKTDKLPLHYYCYHQIYVPTWYFTIYTSMYYNSVRLKASFQFVCAQSWRLFLRVLCKFSRKLYIFCECILFSTSYGWPIVFVLRCVHLVPLLWHCAWFVVP